MFAEAVKGNELFFQKTFGKVSIVKYRKLFFHNRFGKLSLVKNSGLFFQNIFGMVSLVKDMYNYFERVVSDTQIPSVYCMGPNWEKLKKKNMELLTFVFEGHQIGDASNT